MRIALALVLVAACGDNDGPEVIEELPCTPPEPVLPATGRYIDPYAFELPGCVEGGLRDLPGRWFTVDPAQVFSFEYPQFEGTCETGFRRAFNIEDDTDDSDGFTFHTWSDGTRFFTRFSLIRPSSPTTEPFEFAQATVACIQADGTLAVIKTTFDTDRGERVANLQGAPFGLKDEPAKGLELVGEFGSFGPSVEETISAYNLVVVDTHAYVVGPSGFFVFDVADPAAPKLRSQLPITANDVRVVEGNGKRVAFLAPLDDNETFVVDVTDPAAPQVLANLPEYSHSVQVVTAGNKTFLYLANYGDNVPRYDVTNPVAPVRTGAAPVPGELAGVHDLFVDGDRIFANNTTAGLVVYDVDATFASSTERGRMKTSYSHASWVGTTTSGRKVILHGDEGMTASSDLGAFLRILDGDPASATYMSEIGRYQSRPEVGIHNIQLVGNKVYLSYYQDGIRIVDIADPTQPREIAHFNTWDPATAPGRAFEGAIGVRPGDDGLVYVADMQRGLMILREN